MMNMTQNSRSKQQNIVKYWQKQEHKNFVTIRTQFNFDKKTDRIIAEMSILRTVLKTFAWK